MSTHLLNLKKSKFSSKVTKKSPDKKNFAKKSHSGGCCYWAYSSAWLERIPDKDEVASSNLARPTDFFIK